MITQEVNIYIQFNSIYLFASSRCGKPGRKSELHPLRKARAPLYKAYNVGERYCLNTKKKKNQGAYCALQHTYISYNKKYISYYSDIVSQQKGIIKDAFDRNWQKTTKLCEYTNTFSQGSNNRINIGVPNHILIQINCQCFDIVCNSLQSLTTNLRQPVCITCVNSLLMLPHVEKFFFALYQIILYYLAYHFVKYIFNRHCITYY